MKYSVILLLSIVVQCVTSLEALEDALNSTVATPTSCDFEKDGLCGWEQDSTNNYNWTRHCSNSQTKCFELGPEQDKTLESLYSHRCGYYLYIEAPIEQVDFTAKLISPRYSANLTKSGCFSFWYHMRGNTSGKLNVYFKSETDKEPRLMWSEEGNQGTSWRNGKFDLPTVNTTFQIIIEGHRYHNYHSDIAIDDLALLTGDACVAQSCKGRCNEKTSVSSFGRTSNQPCQCKKECFNNFNCCLDYIDYCVGDGIYDILSSMGRNLG